MDGADKKPVPLLSVGMLSSLSYFVEISDIVFS